MARPKTGKPPKKNLMLTVSDQTRMELNFLSAHYGESISALVVQWAAKEAKSVSKRTGTEIPQPGQMSLDDYEG